MMVISILGRNPHPLPARSDSDVEKTPAPRVAQTKDVTFCFGAVPATPTPVELLFLAVLRNDPVHRYHLSLTLAILVNSDLSFQPQV